MKNLILIIALMTAPFANASGTLVAELNQFSMDRNEFKSQPNMGTVTVQDFGKTPTIRLELESRCIPSQAHQMCFQSIMKILDMTLNIQSVEKDSCGSVTYTAVPAIRIPDHTSAITVTDNTNNICESLVARPATEVSYAKYGFAGLYSSSKMSGGVLNSTANKPNDTTEIQPMTY